MNRMRLLALVSGLTALALPAVAGAQSAVGGDKYGGAEVGEDVGTTEDTEKESDKIKKPASETTEQPLKPEDESSPTDTTTEPTEDQTPDTIRRSAPTGSGTGATGTDATGTGTTGTGADTDLDLDANVDVEERTTPAADVTVPVETTTVATIPDQRARLRTPFGMAVSLGGGVTDFVDDDIENMTDVGGAWDARLAIGTRSMIGLEAAYVGSAQDIDALGLDADAALVGNGVEGLARLNLGTYRIQPYVVAGAGWTRYSLVGDDFNTSSVNSEDDVFMVPLGGGLSTYLDGGFMLDARFTYKLAYEEDLLDAGTGNEVTEDLDNWGATMRLGYEF